jgi:hypothetical protein
MGSEDQWYILSAKYGLLNPAMVVGPYNETLNNMRKSERTQWARDVENDLRSLLHPGDRVVFLAGQKYREFLEPALLPSQLSYLNLARVHISVDCLTDFG